MNRTISLIFGLGLLACVDANAQQPVAVVKPTRTNDYDKLFKSEKEKISYAIGVNFGSTLKGLLSLRDVEVDAEMIVGAFKQALTGGATLIDEKQAGEILDVDLRKMVADKFKRAGDEYMAKNKTAPGVVTLPSGLQYKVLAEGKGDSPKQTDIVAVNYRGTFLNGTEFDSSSKYNKPWETPVNRAIQGWTEALQLMKPGAKWQLFVPPQLGYGENGNGGNISPNATLIFEIELVSFKPPEPLTSAVVRVPSMEEINKGAQVKTLTPEEVEKEKAKAAGQTNR